ncbi:hypothetical protein, partial [Flavobacterium circumlabens]|uniref:hypothetical protein n=1 Tax=Flavobacterium circumlabens TaxID=2133765 RepID=UPI001EE8FF4F
VAFPVFLAMGLQRYNISWLKGAKFFSFLIKVPKQIRQVLKTCRVAETKSFCFWVSCLNSVHAKAQGRKVFSLYLYRT